MIAYDPKNWIRVLLDFPRSPIFRTLFLDVLGAGLWAALVVWVETDVFRVAVPLGPSFLSILGIILGLLLVFRTNTAYDRWWEGRRLWGQLVNVSRGLSRHLAVAPLERRARYATMMAEFPSALTSHLRRERGAGGPHLPNQVISDLHTEIRQDAEAGHLGPDALLRLAPLLQQYDDVLGACERIRNTPIPFSYSSYVKQFVLLYAFIMPFGLVMEFGYGTVIASMFTFFATMGLELLAGEIEEPFGADRNDLPLEDISGVIARDVRAILVAAAPDFTPSASGAPRVLGSPAPRGQSRGA